MEPATCHCYQVLLKLCHKWFFDSTSKKFKLNPYSGKWNCHISLSCSPGHTFLYFSQVGGKNKGHTIECGSFVGQFDISLVILAKYFPSRISPSLPGEQQLIIVPGLCHDLLEIWNKAHFFITLTPPTVYATVEHVNISINNSLPLIIW